MQSQIRFAVVLLAVAVGSDHSQAASLTTGVTLAAPGSTVAVSIDLVNPSQDPFTSIDAAVRILSESVDTPLIVGFNAPLEEPFVWAPFSGVSYVPSPSSLAESPVSANVLGVAGSDIGVQANFEGRVMDVSISVPGTAVPGTVHDIDLIDDLSFISFSTPGADPVTEHFSEPLQDGTLRIVTEQILADYECVQSNLFTTSDCGDLNDDGQVDGSDFNIVMNQINALTPNAAAIPEPSLAGWLAIAALALGAFKRSGSVILQKSR